MHGIDVSNNNPTNLDWDGVEFAFIKITEGLSFVDGDAATFIAECNSRGIPWGGYHFAHPDQHAATDEAAFFLEHLSAGWTVAAALDFETYPGHNPLNAMGINGASAWIDQWCSIVDAATSRPPYFYTFKSYAASLYGHINPRWPRWLATASGRPGTTEYAGYPIAIEQWGQLGGIDANESYVPITEEEMAPAHLVLLDDGKIVAFPSCGGPPYHVMNPTVLAIGQITGALATPTPDTPSSAEESAEIRAAIAGSPVTTGAPTHFTGTVDLRAQD